MFIKKAIIFETDYVIAKDELYAAYLEWCKENRLRPQHEAQFFQGISRAAKAQGAAIRETKMTGYERSTKPNGDPVCPDLSSRPDVIEGVRLNRQQVMGFYGMWTGADRRTGERRTVERREGVWKKIFK